MLSTYSQSFAYQQSKSRSGFFFCFKKKERKKRTRHHEAAQVPKIPYTIFILIWSRFFYRPTTASIAARTHYFKRRDKWTSRSSGSDARQHFHQLTSANELKKKKCDDALPAGHQPSQLWRLLLCVHVLVCVIYTFQTGKDIENKIWENKGREGIHITCTFSNTYGLCKKKLVGIIVWIALDLIGLYLNIKRLGIEWVV